MFYLNDPRGFLEGLFQIAVSAADPYAAIKAHLPAQPKGRVVVIGAGKAASQMAAAFELTWGDPVDGVVVARHGEIVRTNHIKVMQSAHPVPDEAGIRASTALLDTVKNLTSDDLVIALISGGGSALLPAPPEGFSLEDEAALHRALLASGAPIAAMNTVRKHFSRIKGGRLAKAAFPARVVSLVVSDIPGDNPAYVASGPTVPDHANADDALQIIKDYNIVLNQRIIEAMSAANAPRPDDVEFSRNEVRVIASARVSLEAAAADARAKGIDVAMLSDSIEGEAKDIGLMHAAFAREIALQNKPFKKPILLLSGGETSVTIGSAPFGKGGRNTEFLLSFALAIDGVNGVYALAADTDGIDGSENNAGAYCDFSSASRLRAAGLHGRQILLGHDAYRAFHAIGDLFVTGQTGTNVNDFRAVLVV